MSEVEEMLEGIVCEVCGELIDGKAPGYPRTCAGCEEAAKT